MFRIEKRHFPYQFSCADNEKQNIGRTTSQAVGSQEPNASQVVRDEVAGNSELLNNGDYVEKTRCIAAKDSIETPCMMIGMEKYIQNTSMHVIQLKIP
ncbi:uncharacterized protein [Watersipora subatra]|uniref:uncharacterized protein isoform X2 n=1 Tax=Watersipora subatra TaxID=2589382 RepID=UPI00355B2490